MKRKLIIAILVVAALAAAAADPLANFYPGGMQISGSGYYKFKMANSFDFSSAQREFNIKPSISMFILYGLSIWTGVEYSSDLSSSTYPWDDERNFSAFAGCEYYMPLAAMKPMPVAAVGAGFGYSSYSFKHYTSASTYTSSNDSNGLYVNVNARFYAFVTDHIAPFLETQFDTYMSNTSTYKDYKVNFYFGLAYFFPPRDLALIK